MTDSVITRALAHAASRRAVLGGGLGTIGALAFPAGAADPETVNLMLPGGPSIRPMTSAFPQKGAMILQRGAPPLLETPMAVFDRDVITPNDRHFVRWHWGDIPTDIDPAAWRIRIGGHVERPTELSLAQLMDLPRTEVVAVNQCSGNSRGHFTPRIPGAQWGHGAMSNARWTGVPLRHVLDLAGVRAGAVCVRFGGADKALLPDAPDFEKSLAIDHARSEEVMVAFAMNGAALPVLNGFPVRLVVPGYFSTYWIKALDSITVLPSEDDGYWMAKAYRVPDTPDGGVMPGAKDFPTKPIGRMIPRSWVTSHAEGQSVAAGTLAFGGIAMGGDSGVARVEASADGGRSWQAATLGPDLGRYSFRRWDARLPLPTGATATLMARCTSAAGVTQAMTPIWNPGGYLRGHVEPVTVRVGGAA